MWNINKEGCRVNSCNAVEIFFFFFLNSNASIQWDFLKRLGFLRKKTGGEFWFHPSMEYFTFTNHVGINSQIFWPWDIDRYHWTSLHLPMHKSFHFCTQQVVGWRRDVLPWEPACPHCAERMRRQSSNAPCEKPSSQIRVKETPRKTNMH